SPGRRCSSRARRAWRQGRSWDAACSVPIERFLLPRVEEAHDEDGDEDRHLDKTVPTQIAEQHRPGEEEDHLDIEDDEKQREHIKVRRVATPRLAHRLLARLVCLQLLARWFEGSKQV